MSAGYRVVALAAVASVLGLAGGCATGGSDGSDAMDQTRRGVADAAISPLRDIGLVRPDIPQPLQGLTYPYQANQLIAGCPQVLYEIGQLDAVLGRENYQPGAKRNLTEQGISGASNATVGLVQDAADDLIPFRGWVRRATGAEDAQKKYIRALELGHTRRAFLRGYGAALGCTGIVPEPPPSADPVDPSTPPPAGRDLPPRFGR
jgi:hypothetical protein